MENMAVKLTKEFWHGKRVFLTGHTGFKGSWLSLWLNSWGAEVTGYALEPPTDPSLFELCRIDERINSVIGDTRDGDRLAQAMHSADPEIVLHLAAQPIVRESYKDPVGTYATNVLGTVNVLEAVRSCQNVRALVNVTTDKCYENKEWTWGYRENEPLGGYDPYSSSKACSELVTASYRSSFFNPSDYPKHGVALATARAGNVIGGGDWALDRLVPDSIRALLKGENVRIRNPYATRPWQHVLEPLSGYMLLAEKLYQEGPRYGEAWNFGPEESDAWPVEAIVKLICEKWGKNSIYQVDDGEHPHEAHYLKLDCSKAHSLLDWRPHWNIGTAIEKVVEWSLAYKNSQDMNEICLAQIEEFTTNP